MDWVEKVADAWPYIAAALTLFLSALAAGHALLHKRDSRSATLWVGFILFAPLVGAILYYLLGINRIKREAQLLRASNGKFHSPLAVKPCSPEELARLLP